MSQDKLRALEDQLNKQKEILKTGKDATEILDSFNATWAEVKNYLTPRQDHDRDIRFPEQLRHQIRDTLDKMAIKFPALNCLLGDLIAPYIDLDYRNYNLLDYWGIGLFYNKRYADARAVFHYAVRPTKEEEFADVVVEPTATKEKKEEKSKPSSIRKLRSRPFREEETTDAKNEDKEENANLWKQIVDDVDSKSAPAAPTQDYKWSIGDHQHNNLRHIWENTQHPHNALRGAFQDKMKVVNPRPFSDLFKLLHRTKWKTPKQIPNKYHIFNPCIINHPTEKEKFLLNLRCGNYHMNMQKLGTGQSVYEYEGKIHTLNCLTTIDASWHGDDFGNINHTGKMIKEEAVPFPSDIAGCEDIRLLWNPTKQIMYAVFTSLEQHESRRPAICITTLDWKRGKFTSPVVRCKGPHAERVEKNWIGFVYNNKVYFVYSMNDILVLELNPENGESRFASYDLCCRFHEWRGSSPPVDITQHSVVMDMLRAKVPSQSKDNVFLQKDKWMLLLVHISAYPHYSHCMVVARLRPLHNSHRPFTFQILFASDVGVFQAHDVEFTCGMQITPESKEIIIPYALRDEFAFCDRYCAESVFQNLKWIGTPDDMIRVN